MDPADLLSDEAFARRIAIGLLRDREAAEDLVQEAWLTVLRNPPKHASRPRNYLARVLQRLTFHKRRAEERRTAREQATARNEAMEGTSALVARAEIHQRTVAAVLALEEPYRSTVLLRFFEDLTPEQIGAREQTPVETVRTRLKRALALLRTRLEREGRDWREEWAIALAGGEWPGPELGSGEPSALRYGSAVAVAVTVGAVWYARSREQSEERVVFQPSAPAAAVHPSAPERAEIALITAPGRSALAGEAGEAPGAPTPGLNGRVTDDAGRPLADVHVRLAIDRFGRAPEIANAVSDDAGRFACSLAGWSALSPTARGLLGLIVEAWTGGHAPFQRRLEHGPDGLPGELAIELSPGRILSACVHDTAGAPIGSVRAIARVHGTDPDLAQHEPTSLTDREGWFAIGLEHGQRVTELVLSAPEGFAYRAEPELPGRTNGDVELGSILLERGHVLRGRCIYPDGFPLRALVLEARLAEPAPGGGFRPADEGPRAELAAGLARHKAFTDESGRFEIQGLRAGFFQLFGFSAGTLLADGRAWSTDGADIELVIPRHRLAVEVVGPDGSLLEEARIAITPLSNSGDPEGVPLRTVTSGPVPRAMWMVEPDDRLAVLAVVPGCTSVEERVAIPSAPYETSLRLALVADERRATLVLRPSAGPSDAWRVDLCAPISGVLLPTFQALLPDDDGRIRGLPLGHHRLRIEPRPPDAPGLPEYCAAIANAPVTLTGGETNFSFAVIRAARLRVLFADTGARPLTLEPIRVAEPGGSGAGTSADRWSWLAGTWAPSRGSLELFSLAAGESKTLRRVPSLHVHAGQYLDLFAPAGPLRLRVALEDREPFEHELSPAAGETLEVLIPVAETGPPR